MKKTLLTLAAAAAIGTAGMSAAPTSASATPFWVAPLIIGGAIVGTAAIATAANAQGTYDPAYGPPPRGTVHVRPMASATQCFWARERVPGGWRRIQVCN